MLSDTSANSLTIQLLSELLVVMLIVVEFKVALLSRNARLSTNVQLFLTYCCVLNFLKEIMVCSF